MSTMTADPAQVQAAPITSAAGLQVMVYAGIDTHKDSHTVAVINAVGTRLGTASFSADRAGHAALIGYVSSFGTPARVGVEGTSSYGQAITTDLRAEGLCVREVTRPNRQTRRCRGKSDPIDALNAARAAADLDFDRTSAPKHHDGAIESLRVLRADRRHAVTARAKAMQIIKSTLVTAPAPIKHDLSGLSDTALIATCARMQPDPTALADPAHGTRRALARLARRYQTLSTDIEELDTELAQILAVIPAGPELLAMNGVGLEVAGQLLLTAGGNPERLHNEASFAALCGVAPIPASSGKNQRHRLSRGADRQANKALHTIIISRLRWDQNTRDYMQRRLTEGKTRREVIRCLKRYIARTIYNTLTS